MSLSWREGRTDSGAASAQDPAARSNVLSDSTGGGLARHVQRHVARLVVGLGLRHRLMLLAERQARHRTIVAPDAIERWQLDAFNRIWAGATQRFRFYADWKRRHRLPDRIGAMADLTGFPVLRATDIEQNLEGIVEDAGSSSPAAVPAPRVSSRVATRTTRCSTPACTSAGPGRASNPATISCTSGATSTCSARAHGGISARSSVRPWTG